MKAARGGKFPTAQLLLAALALLAILTVVLRPRTPPAPPAEDRARAEHPPAHRQERPPAAEISPTDPPEATATTATVDLPPAAGEDGAAVTTATVLALERDLMAHPGDALLEARLTRALAALGAKLFADGQAEAALGYLARALEREPGDDRSRLLTAAIHLDAGRTSAAEVALLAVTAAGKQGAAYHGLAGEVAYARGDLDRAIEELRLARSLAADPRLDARLAALEREATAGGSSRSLSSRRFTVTFDGGENQAAARLVLAALEQSYDELKREFRLEDFTVPAILHSAQSYRDVIGAPDWSAGLYDGKIRIPTGGLERVEDEFRATLKHELAHAFITRKGGSGVPRWLHEGLAQYYQGRRIDPARIDADARSVLAAGREPDDVRLFYAQALLRTQFLFHRHRTEQVMAVLDALRQGADFAAAWSRTLGPWPRFLEDYRRSVEPKA